MHAQVIAVHRSPLHGFSKTSHPFIDLVAGQGVLDDTHAGVTVQHRSRVAKDPTQPNLRQVHLIHQELFEEVAALGLPVQPGQMGENITTTGLDVLALSEGTLLHIGAQAVVQVTGLRNPCAQIEAFRPGLLAAVLDRTAEGALVRKAGIMGIVKASGRVQPGDPITLIDAPAVHRPLQPV